MKKMDESRHWKSNPMTSLTPAPSITKSKQSLIMEREYNIIITQDQVRPRWKLGQAQGWNKIQKRTQKWKTDIHIFQLGVIGVFIQAIARNRVLIILPKTHGEVLPKLKE
jgi:hypothetical protein